MVVYTIVDIRYKFRLAVAPVALNPITLALIVVIGIESVPGGRRHSIVRVKVWADVRSPLSDIHAFSNAGPHGRWP